MKLVEFIGTKIKEYRQNANLSQTEFAKKMGTAANTISRWETGTYKPTVDDLEKVSRFFGVSILKFFPESDSADADDKIKGLARAAKGLSDNDLSEVEKFIEFRKAQALLKTKKK